MHSAGRINWRGLAELLRICAKLEDKNLIEEVKNVTRQKKNSDSRNKIRIDNDNSEISSSLDVDPDEISATETSNATWEIGDERSHKEWLARGRTLSSVDDYVAFRYWKKINFDVQEVNGESDRQKHKEFLQSYIDGLQWVMLYYFSGVPSWSWYYPYHYAPFTRDLVKFLDTNPSYRPQFNLGEPFQAFEQLLAVLPPQSSALVPKVFRKVMSDKEFGVKHFYPKEFRVDMENVKVSWGGIPLLPFIEEQKLFGAMKKALKTGECLTSEEKERSLRGSIKVFSTTTPKTDTSFVSTILDNSPILYTKVSIQIPEWIESSVPRYLPPVANPTCRIMTLPVPFQFRALQTTAHSSKTLSRHRRDNTPTFFEAHVPQTPNLTHLATGSKILSLKYAKNVIRPFKQPGRRMGVILNVAPDNLQPNIFKNIDQIFVRSLELGVQKPYDPESVTDPTMYDLSWLPLARRNYPYKTMTRVIGVLSPILGYVPLTNFAREVPFSLTNPDRRDPVLSVEWKSQLPKLKQANQFYYEIADELGNQLERQGIAFDAKPFVLQEGPAASYAELMKNLHSLVGESFGKLIIPKEFSWKDLLFEVVDHEEISQQLGNRQ